MALFSEHVHVRFLRYSAFYTPLLLTLNSKTLQCSGVKVTYDRATPERTVDQGFEDGSVQVAQSAPAVSFRSALEGKAPAYRHFAVMNTRDGFFLAARPGTTAAAAAAVGPQWHWNSLAGSTALIDHFFQPLALFKTALRCQGVDEGSMIMKDVGSPDQIVAAFRGGLGDVVHLQGPAPQQLEEEGLCKVVASVGASAVPLAFSSLCATPEWLQSPAAPIFMSAFSEARAHAAAAPPEQIAEAVAPFLPEFSLGALTKAIAAYQEMGTWLGDEMIDAELYQQTVKVFLDVGYMDKVPPMSLVVASPPNEH